MSTTDNLIIFVHGTGAADSLDQGERWWQSGSAFSDTFAPYLESGVTVAPPFHWSGSNSELARRIAGQALLDRLLALAETGQRIHLIGHSHGGSVIWHALTMSAARNSRLNCLTSWCTVGTPFLTFAPQWPNVWRWLAALLTSAVLFHLASISNYQELPAIAREIWQHGNRVALVGYFALSATATALCIWAVLRVLIPAIGRALFSIRRSEAATAANWYGDLWLGLWHPLDEPINSLAGTMGPAPEIAPRRKLSLLFRIIPPLGWLWDSIIMRAADEFAWRQVTNRAQGADLANLSVVDVGRAPKPLEPGFGPLSHDIVAALTESADTHSMGLVSKVRALLGNVYDQRGTEALVARMGEILTFQELVHTSYFDNPEIAKIVAAFVHAHAGAAVKGEGLPAFVPRRAAPVSDPHAARTPPRGALEFVTATAMFILPALGLWISIRTTTEAVVTPYTVAYQFESIRDYVEAPRTLAAGNGSKVAALLLQLKAKGLINDPTILLDRITQGKHRRQAAMRLAYDYGRENQFAGVQQLLARQEPAALYPEYTARLRLLAIIGYATRLAQVSGDGAATKAPDYDPAVQALIDTHLENLGETLHFGNGESKTLTKVAIQQLALSGAVDRAQQILELVRQESEKSSTPSTDQLCEFAQAVAVGRAVRLPQTKLGDLIELCDDDDKYQLLREVAFRILGNDGARALSDFAWANAYQGLTPERIETVVRGSMTKNRDSSKIGKTLSSLIPDLVLLEQALPADTLAGKLNTGWPAQLGRNQFGLLASLAQQTRTVGATRTSDILLDVAERAAAAWKTPQPEDRLALIKALRSGGRKDQVDKAYSQFSEYIASPKAKESDHRLIELSIFADAAAELDDKATLARIGDEMTGMAITEPGPSDAHLIADVADHLSKFDSARASALMTKAQSVPLLAGEDLYRQGGDQRLVASLVKEGAIRQARLDAMEIGSTDWTLDALSELFKPRDNSITDFSELKELKDEVTKIIDGNSIDDF